MKTAKTGLLHQAFIESKVDKLPPTKAVSVVDSASVLEAIQSMVAHKVGCVLVTGPGGAPRGIFTERDILNRIWPRSEALSAIPVNAVMTENPQTLKYHASIGKALYLMTVGGFRHIPVEQRDGSWSIVSVRDFTRFLYHKMQTRKMKEERGEVVLVENNDVELFLTGDVSSIRAQKPVTASEGDTVESVVAKMRVNSLGSLVITKHEQGRVLGVFSERDLMNRIITERDQTRGEPISRFMTRQPVTLQPTTSVLYALQVMVERSFRHMPIVDFEERLTGILSIKDFVQTLAEGVVESLSHHSS
jgi:CBS domain-containing protein